MSQFLNLPPLSEGDLVRDPDGHPVGRAVPSQVGRIIPSPVASEVYGPEGDLNPRPVGGFDLGGYFHRMQADAGREVVEMRIVNTTGGEVVEIRRRGSAAWEVVPKVQRSEVKWDEVPLWERICG